MPIAQIPPMMKQAVLAIEDARFYEHKGIDWVGAARAVKANVTGGFGSGGASTITMQVARNFFLSKEKVLSRKLNEVVLAYKIEDALTKDQILELYMNQIYLGQRSYGFASAARSYFSKKLDQLTIAETAMLAGLPQNPSRHNPAVNPKRAKLRQEQVLRRMRDLKLHRRSPVCAGGGRTAARALETAGIRHPRPVRGRTGAPGGVRPVRRRVVHARHQGDHDHRFEGPGSGLRFGAAQRAGLRQPPRLPRPGSAHRTARERRRTRRRHRRGAAKAPVERRPGAGGGGRRLAEIGEGRDHRWRHDHDQGRRPEIRRSRPVGQSQGNAAHRAGRRGAHQ